MSLNPQPGYTVPAETAKVAKAIFTKGNLCITMADRLDSFVSDQDFSTLFSHQGQPGVSPVRLALVTILQYIEGLTDRQAADAVRSRIDWKYLLCLELTDKGFDHTVLSEFRTRLIAQQAESLVFDQLLSWCQQQGWLQARGRQRTDSTHVVATIRAVTRLECAGETLRAALNALAVVAPAWLQAQSQPEWIERYSERMEDYHLPTSKAAREEQAHVYGEDGKQLLDAIFDGHSPEWLQQVPAVETLRRVWVQQYYVCNNEIYWRTEQGIPPATLMISSPYDLDAHYSKKNTTSWVGYKVHLSETCEPNSLHLITNVETTAAPIADGDVTEAIHTSLANKDLLPSKHIVDTGYLDAELLVTAQQEHQVQLLGPTRSDLRWQSKAGNGFAASDFKVDWQQEVAICPEGKTSTSWTPAIDGRNNEVIKIKFARADCANCPSLHLCTRTKEKRRLVTLRPEAQYKALQAARKQAMTDEYKADYARRAGIEATLSESIRAHGLRHARYIGLAKTHLQHLMTATAINFKRIFHWLSGIPQATTRTSQFAKLMAQSVG
ncbi:IS1182-like element ISNpu1 family transposase [Nostoc punctiforme]|uniref:Transposase IS4 family protein n=1 Tax=Nostoc punctiforme (strain ATCC 29133 / PCC 73102) TaxID=63737 RepID=B2JC10_NOSP7|nr:IS1182-like element ISNpu1 family transposase [Nostoc punctiforme]ACC85464.1 transposase IS4 family protein [Nostoc punctiforme PCC 73102]